MLPAASPNPEIFELLIRVFDEAWVEMQTMLGTKSHDANFVRWSLAKRIMAAANDGERDPAQLKLIALQAIDA